MTPAVLLQKYRAHAKELLQKATYKDMLAQTSQVLDEAGLETMLRKLGNVGLQAMLAASGMANQSYTAPGINALAGTEQVRLGSFCGLS